MEGDYSVSKGFALAKTVLGFFVGEEFQPQKNGMTMLLTKRSRMINPAAQRSRNFYPVPCQRL